MPIHTTMTYGNMPTREEWDAAWERTMTRDVYQIHLSTSDSRVLEDFTLGTGEYECGELYAALKEITDHERPPEDAMTLVSCVLETLGIEWI